MVLTRQNLKNREASCHGTIRAHLINIYAKTVANKIKKKRERTIQVRTLKNESDQIALSEPYHCESIYHLPQFRTTISLQLFCMQNQSL